MLSDERTISYVYDAEERITKVIDSVDGTTEYTYDALGQLLSETVIRDGVSTVVNTMTYSDADRPGCYGNILSKNGVTYEYDSVWKDRLVKVGNDPISYDAQGNPLNYLGHALTWEKGRQLKSFQKKENGVVVDTISYTYNANGIRTSKTVGGVRHDYLLDGAKLLREAWNYDANTGKYADVLTPLYDNEESVCGVIYNNHPYYFLKNLQGDVIAIVDKDAETVARYTYDAWGVCTVTQDNSGANIANINPFRYRGYYYDQETGLYYLQSRYYDPETGRFINADDPRQKAAETSNVLVNSFAYCSNCVITYADPNGYKARKIVGYGVQVMINLHMLMFNFSFGAELVWYNKNYGKHKKSSPWGYKFYGTAMTFSFNPAELLGDFGKKRVKAFSVSTLKTFVNGLKKSGFLNNLSAKTVCGSLGLAPSIDLSLCAFEVSAEKFKHPRDYLGKFTLTQKTILGVTNSKGVDKKKNVMSKGIGLSVTISTFPFSFSLLTFGNGGGQAIYSEIPFLFKE